LETFLANKGRYEVYQNVFLKENSQKKL